MTPRALLGQSDRTEHEVGNSNAQLNPAPPWVHLARLIFLELRHERYDLRRDNCNRDDGQ